MFTPEQIVELKGIFAESVSESVNKTFNGYDARAKKEAKKLEPAMAKLESFSKMFGDMKPKKLAKLLQGKKEKKNKPEGEQTPESEAKPEAKPEGGKAPIEKKQFKRLTAEVESIKAERDAAKAQTEKAERRSAVSSALGDFNWASPKSRDLVFEHYFGKVKRSESGELVMEDEDGEALPFQDFIREDIPTQFDFALAPKNTGGSGVQKGKSGNRATTLDDIDKAVASGDTKEIDRIARELAALL